MSLIRSGRSIGSNQTQFARSIWSCQCLQTSEPPRSHPKRYPSLVTVRHATHGAAGRANGPKNNAGRRLGAKKTGDEYVVPGNILFRQRGTKWFPGENCGMGRDHTIFAQQPGYVKYYRDPEKHPKRRFIGIVFEKMQTLPHSTNAPRRRRLGMVAVPRSDVRTSVIDGPGEGHAGNEVGMLGDVGKPLGDLPVAQAAVGSDTGDSRSAGLQTKAMRKRKATGRVSTDDLNMRPDYSYRESNAEIGRAAERAGVKVKLFVKGDRFLAWRRKTARKKRAAEKRAMVRQGKGKKNKAVKKTT